MTDKKKGFNIDLPINQHYEVYGVRPESSVDPKSAPKIYGPSPKQRQRFIEKMRKKEKQETVDDEARNDFIKASLDREPDSGNVSEIALLYGPCPFTEDVAFEDITNESASDTERQNSNTAKQSTQAEFVDAVDELSRSFVEGFDGNGISKYDYSDQGNMLLIKDGESYWKVSDEYLAAKKKFLAELETLGTSLFYKVVNNEISNVQEETGKEDAE